MDTKDVIIGILAIALVMTMSQHGKTAGNTVLLRTDAPSGSLCPTSIPSGTQIALDVNADGILECYEKADTSSVISLITTYATSKDGCAIGKSSSSTSYLRVHPLSGGTENRFSPATCSISSSTAPTEPYTSNGQEVYSGTCVPSCGCAASICTTATCSDGCGGTCQGTQACTGGQTCFQTFINNANAWLACQ